MEFPVGVKDPPPGTKQYTRLSIRPGPNGSWLVALDDGRHEPQVFMDKHLALTYAKAWAAANRPSKLQVMGQTAHVEQEWTFA
ncbi:MAG TPA: hypothetical protein VKC64_15665 [Burkholderiales bacterium]|nr:hypothetical protein [Burkholderiales bacterium]